MFKINTFLSKKQLILIFIAIFLFKLLLIQLFKYLPIIGPEKSFNFEISLTFGGLFAVLLLAMFEEFTSRYFIKIIGWLSFLWFFLYSYFALILPFLVIFKIDLLLIDLYVLVVGISLTFIINKFKHLLQLTFLFTPSLPKIAISVTGFGLLHINNYAVTPNQLWYMIPIILLTHCPFAYFLTKIHLNYKYGFWIATGFHFLNNVLALIIR